MISYSVFYDVYESQSYNLGDNNPSYQLFKALSPVYLSYKGDMILSNSAYCGAFFLGVF